MKSTPETHSGPGESPRTARCFCGYDRSGLGDDDLCPECGELRIEPDGLVAKVRHAWQTSTSGPLRASWGAACISAGASFLLTCVLAILFTLGILGLIGEGFFFIPILAWLFAVAPIGLFGILGALTGLGSGDRRLAAYTALLSIMAIIIPVVFFFLAIFLIRSFT